LPTICLSFFTKAMQLVDRVSSAGYGYVSPTIDRACKVLPLVGRVKHTIEPYAPPLIKKADMCIDAVYTVAEGRITAVRGIVNSAGEKVLEIKTSASGKAQKFVGENALALRLQQTTLAMVDTLDQLIDRYLPEPPGEAGSTKAEVEAPKYSMPRMLRVPLKIPARMIHITVVRMQNGYEAIHVNFRWAMELTADQKAKFKALVYSHSRAIADRASASSLAVSLKNGKMGASKKMEAALDSFAAGKDAIKVKCYVVCERLHVFEVQDVAMKNIGSLQQSTAARVSGIVETASQYAFGITAYVAGKERATGIFTMIAKRLPMMEVAIPSSSSTGALSDTSEESEPRLASSTGTPAAAPPAKMKPSVPVLKMPVKQDDDQSQEWQGSPVPYVAM